MADPSDTQDAGQGSQVAQSDASSTVAQDTIQTLLQQHSAALTGNGTVDPDAYVQVVSNLMKVQDITGTDLTSGDIIDQLHQTLASSNNKTPAIDDSTDVVPGSPAEADDASVADSTDAAQSDVQSTLVTPLGGAIITSSVQPAANIPNVPTLPTAGTLSTYGDPSATVIATNVVAVDSTAPQDLPHANTWQDAVAAGRSGDSMVLDGAIVNNPALVTTDTAGNIVKVPLSLAVDSPTPTIPINAEDPDIRPVAANIPQGPVDISIHNDEPISAVLPPQLVAGNVAQSSVPPGFTLSGNINLFGRLPAEHYSFHGTAGDEMAEMAIITKPNLRFDELLPGSGFSIALVDPRISLYIKPTPTGRDPGLWLETGLVIEDNNIGKELHDVLATVPSRVDAAIYLGTAQSLSADLALPKAISVDLTFSGTEVKIGNFLELTSLTCQFDGTYTASGYSWAMTAHGSSLWTVPGSVAALATSYNLTKQATNYAIEVGIASWRDAMGLSGFHLDTVTAITTFISGDKSKTSAFDIHGSLGFGATSIPVQGHYSSGAWGFQAQIGDLSWTQLESAFAKLFGTTLSPCNHDVAFSNLSLNTNSNDKTLSLNGNVVVDGYSCADISLALSATGIHLTGNLNTVRFDHVTIQKAVIDLQVTKAGLVSEDPGTSASFNITGEITVTNVTIDATVSFVKETGGLLWVVYAKANVNYRLSEFVHVPTDLDFGLENVAVMASNTMNASSFTEVFEYPVKKGFQLFAKIDCPPALAKSMHSSPGAMILELDLAELKIDLHFAAEQNLTLKHGMTAPDIKAGVKLAGTPQLFIEGDMPVALPGSPQPLIFGLRLQVGPTEAQASASLLTDWVNPFNISPRLKVLSPVTLGVIIDYVAATYPSGLNFAGGFQLGQTVAKAAFEVGENPSDGVLLVQVDNLGLHDIVAFVSLVIEHQLPMPADDILFFKDLFLGLSSGGTIGAVFYPPGVTFNADIILFGKEITIHAAVDKSLPGFSLHGEIEPFNLGPLTVSGNQAKTPVLDVQFGPSNQHLLLDGKITLFDAELALTLKVDMVPLDMEFDTEIKFSDLLLCQVNAHVSGAVHSIKDVVHSDFTFYANFEQKLLDHMMALANTYIAAAKKAADEGLDSAQTKLTQTEKAFNDHLARCRADLNAAGVKWEKKSADVHAAVQAQRDAIAKDEAAKQKAVDAAHAAFDQKIAELQRKLDQTRSDAANEIKTAQNNLDQENRNATNDVNAAVKKIHDAQQDLNNRFGSADARINDARNHVASAQRTVDDLQRQVDHCNWEIHHGSIDSRIKCSFQITGLGVALGGAKAGLGTAQGVLQAAYGVVNSVGYQAAQGTLKAAEGALDGAKATAAAGIAASKASLSVATATANASNSAASATLDAAKKGCNELQVWKMAQDTLAAFLKTRDGLLAAADRMEQGLAQAAEKVAFDAANAALAAATSATKELDAAKAVVAEVEKGVDHVIALGKWLVDHAGNIFNVRQVELSGSLGGAASKQPFSLHIRGSFADCAIDVHADFLPGQAEEMVKNLVMKWMDEARTDLAKFVAHH